MGQGTKSAEKGARVSSRVRRAYLGGLSLIAAISICTFWVERQSIDRFDNLAEIVNTSGKQRMLSQRILIFANRLIDAGDATAAEEARKQIAGLRAEFVSNHDRIMNMGVEYGGNDSLTEGSLKVYYGGRYFLADRIRSFIEDVDILLGDEAESRAKALDRIEEAVDGQLLISLDAAVSQFERDAKGNVMDAMQLHLMMLIILMLTLLAELLFIFRPMVKRVDDRTRELLEARDEMKHAALHDQLTGLPNRRLLNEIMANTLAQSERLGRPMTVCHIDLDYFKIINDTRGHAVGDAVLIHVAKVLNDATRSSDFIARVGGDEFVIVDCLLGGAEGALILANRIIERLSQPFEIEGETCRIGASIGISEHSDEDPDLEAVLHRSDIALYYAKKLGRGNAVIYSAEAQQSFDKRALLAA